MSSESKEDSPKKSDTSRDEGEIVDRDKLRTLAKKLKKKRNKHRTKRIKKKRKSKYREPSRKKKSKKKKKNRKKNKDKEKTKEKSSDKDNSDPSENNCNYIHREETLCDYLINYLEEGHVHALGFLNAMLVILKLQVGLV